MQVIKANNAGKGGETLVDSNKLVEIYKGSYIKTLPEISYRRRLAQSFLTADQLDALFRTIAEVSLSIEG